METPRGTGLACDVSLPGLTTLMQRAWKEGLHTGHTQGTHPPPSAGLQAAGPSCSAPPFSEVRASAPMGPGPSDHTLDIWEAPRALQLPEDTKSLIISNHDRVAATCQAVSEEGTQAGR